MAWFRIWVILLDLGEICNNHEDLYLRAVSSPANLTMASFTFNLVLGTRYPTHQPNPIQGGYSPTARTNLYITRTLFLPLYATLFCIYPSIYLSSGGSSSYIQANLGLRASKPPLVSENLSSITPLRQRSIRLPLLIWPLTAS